MPLSVFLLRCTSYQACSEQLSQEMLSVILVVAESYLLPPMSVEDNLPLEHNFALPARNGGGALNMGTLNSCVATVCSVPEFTGIIGELVDVLFDFVFPSERDVTYLSNPRLTNTQETKFSICKELILISILYLPY